MLRKNLFQRRFGKFLSRIGHFEVRCVLADWRSDRISMT